LLRANDMEVTKEGKINMSDEMYNTWFGALNKDEYGRLSANMMSHFGVLLENSEIILKNSDYSGLWLPLLQSGMMISGVTRYTLGALLNCWIGSDDLVINKEIYIIKVGGSELSGMCIYVGWSSTKRKIVTGGIGGFPKNALGYYKVFNDLSKISKFTRRSDLVVARELFDKLGIPY
jgi:hypothetical protein